ncbi:methyl-accepting chemotaxis protein [Selenihalanaerobacter shriftii]|uniref:Methyl-accepting chemotaxis sensory transducer with TarH sensor n=1 Tax=Selenihalanaerobacter shriftii TaxID=142842 RepID=A0A1T4PPQ9_9FIRM|nr:methyl-accepting chemotaxis protein [Selenihalanaerobacter shriftii]SJZ93550.1 methyl-accepting chemotaxis sensory transducer with TarH sensor [Selenihalanaerobacter shriftii]
MSLFKKIDFKNVSIRFKLLVAFMVLIILPTIILGYFSYQNAKKELTNLGKDKLQRIVKDATLLTDALNKQVQAGEISLDEAKEEAKFKLIGPKTNKKGVREIKNTVGESGYIYATNSEGIFTLHPRLEGSSFIKDGTNTGKIGKEVVKRKEGFYKYAWKNPGEKEFRDKIIAMEYYKPWDWIICAGAYEEDFYQPANKIKYTVYLILAISIIVGGIVASFLTKRLTDPIEKLVIMMKEAGKGDLTNRVEINTRDELETLGNEFNSMLDKVTDIIRKIHDNSEETTSFSQQILGLVGETNSNIQETSATMEEMSAGIQQIGANAEQVGDFSQKAAKNTQNGNEVIQNTIAKMNSISDKVEDISNTINKLNNKSEQIGEITEMITDIADQTNLLALNANIEAARAGEHGRGFAVVAEEIRGLAEESAKAADRISSLIDQTQEESHNALESVNVGTKETTAGVEMIDEAGESFKNITVAIEEVTQQIQEVSGAIQQMASSSDEVVHATQEISQSSEKIGRSTEELAKMAEELEIVANQFEIK